MSLESPSVGGSSDPSSNPTPHVASPSPSFNTILMATNPQTTPHPNATGVIAVRSPVSTPTTPPSSDWPSSRSPNPVGSEGPSDEAQNQGTGDGNGDVDPQIIEALRSKDRLYVLKLGELMEGLINDRKARIDLTPSTSYQRLLVHRCSAFHKLSPETDPVTKIITVPYSPESRIPARRLSELVPAESSTQPAFKIMRRETNERRSKPHSQAGSIAGDDADLSDVEPSEAGSLGGRSKKRMTIEEREAAYNEARSRIFMDFQEKEKEKEKDMSASSSTQSLVSGSASSSGLGRSSSIDDLDDSVSTPATESEWSGPVTRDRRDLRHMGSGNMSTASSSRSLRSTAPAFNANGSSSSRNSRAPSPAFKYASLYEPAPTTAAAPYDSSQSIGGKPPPFVPQYPYGYPAQGPVPQNQQAYMSAYPNYPPYSYPPQNPMTSPDTASQDMYMNPNQTPAQYVPYANPYVWSHAHQPQPGPVPLQPSHVPNHQNHQISNPNQHPPNSTSTPFSPPYIPQAPYGSYPMTGYYPPQPGQQMPPPHPQMMGQPIYNPDPRAMNGLGSITRNGYDNGGISNHSRTSSRNSTGNGSMNGGKRGAPPARAAWSYGPGIGMGGFVGNTNGGGSGEAVGPRLSSMRRPSQTSSVGSGSAGNRTPAGDEASSTASSSTTSSSSRRTYTSTTSSQHPLPPRPDWAVGLKPQPTLHSSHSRHHDHSLSSSRSSPARNGHQPSLPPSQQMSPVALQPTDFPPLTTLGSPPPEKRAPAGAWTNASSTRSILMPSPGHANSQGRLEDPERGFERPPPKGNAELFNPKGTRRSNSNNSRSNSVPQAEGVKQPSGDAVANLIDQVTSFSMAETGPASPPAVKSIAVVKTST